VKVTRGVAAALGALVFLAGCTSGARGDKAGGPGSPVVLTLASVPSGLEYSPSVAYFVDRVAKLSGGRLRVDVVNEWGNFGPDAEQRVVRDVAAGKADLGWVGTRVMDTLGASDFRALTAPMLIDSYVLQDAVLGSDIPGQMMRGLQPLGVAGLAVLAGGMRRPAAVKRPLLGVADWRGLVVSTGRSNGNVIAVRALGATPVDPGTPARDEALAAGQIDASEVSLLVYRLNDLAPRMPYTAANVNLWPFTAAILINPGKLGRLGRDQRTWLATAATDAATHARKIANRDAELAAEVCTAGAQFATADPAALEALRQAFEPVYAELERDAKTLAYIRRIQALKASTRPEPGFSLPTSCAPPARAGGPASPPASASTSELDGVYRWTLTVEDARSHGVPNDQLHLDDWYPSTFTVTLRRGTWEAHQTADAGTAHGTYTVTGDRITFEWPSEHTLNTFTFTVGTNGDLTLRPVPPMGAGDQFVWSTHPWAKID
jgi:TRAP-type C4-dicarboxylate transport system substrate-binding protein